MGRASVGKSERTPAKHALMDRLLGKEAGVCRVRAKIKQLKWYDLTAGDAVAAGEIDWIRHCSPGLFAYHALDANKAGGKPIDVFLFERAPETFERLRITLGEKLPQLGYLPEPDGSWRCGLAAIHLTFGSGADAVIAGVNASTAVFVANDPNAITDWAMRPTFAEEIRLRTPWFRIICTMGCNPAGLKRIDFNVRDQWFELVNQVKNRLPPHHNLFLAAIEGDNAQWAYLIQESRKWKDDLEKDAQSSFGHFNYALECAWLKGDSASFESILKRLFYTKNERE